MHSQKNTVCHHVSENGSQFISIIVFFLIKEQTRPASDSYNNVHVLLHGIPVKISEIYWFPPALLFIIPLACSNHNHLYSPADKPMTRYINSFWSCLKFSLTAKSTHRANNSTELSQFELVMLCFSKNFVSVENKQLSQECIYPEKH